MYVTPGSSGDDRLLGKVLEGLAGLPLNIIAATAGRDTGSHLPANVRAAAYLPGLAAAERADVVICNGGSPTVQQALAAATPVLGICSNLDQYLNMQAVEAIGAGRSMRAGKATAASIRQTVQELLASPDFRQAAEKMADTYRGYDAGSRFAALLERILKVSG